MNRIPVWFVVSILVLLGVVEPVTADQLDDDFNSGLDLSQWVVHSNQPTRSRFDSTTLR